ncbi:MAG: ChaB family protein [Cyanobacteria bacterium J06597_1]
MSSEYRAERTVSAVFQEQSQVEQLTKRLLDRGVPSDHISVMGQNFQTETRISGFITKRDVILGGLRSGAIFGSFFGTLFSLLSGVGVLFVPFVGPVVAAGPIGAALLGAASGALAGSAGAGLVSVFTALGMPEEKAAVYQTRLKAGEFVVMAEVPADKTGEFQLMLEGLGGEEVHINNNTLPRACSGECESAENLSPEIRSHLSEDAQSMFISRYNSVLSETSDASAAESAAWQEVRSQFDEDESGVWSKQKVTA